MECIPYSPKLSEKVGEIWHDLAPFCSIWSPAIEYDPPEGTIWNMMPRLLITAENKFLLYTEQSSIWNGQNDPSTGLMIELFANIKKTTLQPCTAIANSVKEVNSTCQSYSQQFKVIPEL